MAVFEAYAPYYGSIGWKVLPLSGKHPLIKNWPTLASNDTEQILEWGKQWPHSNIGIKTGRDSGIFVIDIDGEAGEQSLIALIAQHGEFEETRQARTGRGRHLYFLYPDGVEIRNDAGRKLGTGIDVRGEGGYVVAPGSIHPENGQQYEWLNSQAVLKEAPVWLVNRLAQTEATHAPRTVIPAQTESRQLTHYANKALASAQNRIVQASQGIRNHTLNSEAYSIGQLVASGALSEHEAQASLEEAGHAAGLTPLEIVRTIQSGLQAGQKQPRDLSTLQNPSLESASTIEWHEPKALPNTLPTVDAFEPSLLPNSFRPWLEDVAERLQCPLDFPAIGAMVALASVVGRQVGIRPKAQDDWLVIPNLWGAIVGRPGLMKTPSLQETLKPLSELEKSASQEYQTAYKHWEAAELVSREEKSILKKEIQSAIRKKADPQLLAMAALSGESDSEPTRKRYLVNDSTVEKLGEILSGNPNGVLLFRDELTGFLRGLDKQGQEGSRSFFLEAWNGNGRFTFDRIGRGTVEIEAATLSILGGIQPGPLNAYLQDAFRNGAGDDGLLQRFQMLVWPDVSKQWRNVDRTPNKPAREQAYFVFNRLAYIDAGQIKAETGESEGIPFLRFTPEAQALFTTWRTALETRLHSGDEHPTLEAHLSKYRSLIPSLALLIHLADTGRGPVGLQTLEKACNWGTYLESHAKRLYSYCIGSSMETAKRLMKQLQEGKLPNPFTLRDVYRHGWTGLTDSADIKKAAEILEDHDILKRIEQKTNGRPKEEYMINPYLLRQNASDEVA